MNEQAATTSATNNEPQGRRVANIRHPDFVMFDEVRINLKERWKESELSGDEWRFSAVIEFLWKGAVLYTKGYGSMNAAIMALGYEVLRAGDDGFPNDCIHAEKSLCAQPGCKQGATVFYRVKATYERSGHKTELPPPYNPNVLHAIGFCSKHKRRGDCGLQDSDSNYEQIGNPYAEKAS